MSMCSGKAGGIAGGGDRKRPGGVWRGDVMKERRTVRALWSGEDKQ